MFYKLKRFSSEMIQNANFNERIVYLQQVEELKQAEGQESLVSKQLMDKYDTILKGEKKDIMDFDQKLQEITFDYFNLIVREYYMAVDKWGQAEEYTSEIKVNFDQIDKQLDD